MKANKESVKSKLKIARGQLDGIEKMIDEERYCLDIVTQLLSNDALIKKIIVEVLEAHIMTCVKDSIVENSGDEKLEEAIKIIERIIK